MASPLLRFLAALASRMPRVLLLLSHLSLLLFLVLTDLPWDWSGLIWWGCPLFFIIIILTHAVEITIAFLGLSSVAGSRKRVATTTGHNESRRRDNGTTSTQQQQQESRLFYTSRERKQSGLSSCDRDRAKRNTAPHTTLLGTHQERKQQTNRGKVEVNKQQEAPGSPTTHQHHHNNTIKTQER
jgi:hypothetical protein